MNLSDCGEDYRQEIKAQSNQRRLKKNKKAAKKYKIEVDTNVFQISMDCLKNNVAEIATGDPQFCSQCKAVFNSNSNLAIEPQMGADPKQVWTCEFCCTKNDVLLD